MITEFDKDTIVKTIISQLELRDKDFTTTELATLLSVNPKELSRLAGMGKVYGSYQYGRVWRYRKAEIMFRRSMGLNILKS